MSNCGDVETDFEDEKVTGCFRLTEFLRGLNIFKLILGMSTRHRRKQNQSEAAREAGEVACEGVAKRSKQADSGLAMYRSVSLNGQEHELAVSCPGPATLHNYYTRSSVERSRTASTVDPGTEQYLRTIHEKMVVDENGWPSPCRFPFQKLPEDCKLTIFSLLTTSDRGRASQVCRDWARLMKAPELWSDLSLTSFPQCFNTSRSHVCTQICYVSYRRRMQSLISYLTKLAPVVHHLDLSFDIGESEDGWKDRLLDLLKASRLNELSSASLNWKETPAKPFSTECRTWSTNDYNEFMYRHRHRQRHFLNLFEVFTSLAPNIRRLRLPFEWSSRSLQYLSRLKKLDTLLLEKYFVFQPLSQDSLDRFFLSVPRLRHLVLEVWTPSGRGMELYSIKSDSLTHLDVSQCRGFFLASMHTPALLSFKVARHPWSGPLTSVDEADLPCMYDVLRCGTPALRQLNEHTLAKNWRNHLSEELTAVLRSVCSCRRHKHGWAM